MCRDEGLFGGMSPYTKDLCTSLFMVKEVPVSLHAGEIHSVKQLYVHKDRCNLSEELQKLLKEEVPHDHVIIIAPRKVANSF